MGSTFLSNCQPRPGASKPGDASISELYFPQRAARLHSARWIRASCAAFTSDSWPDQISSAGCWIARANEKVSGQGILEAKRTFIAFSRSACHFA